MYIGKVYVQIHKKNYTTNMKTLPQFTEINTVGSATSAICRSWVSFFNLFTKPPLIVPIIHYLYGTLDNIT